MKTLTKDEFMEAWSIDRARIVFKDGKAFIGCATYVSDVKEIVDLDK